MKLNIFKIIICLSVIATSCSKALDYNDQESVTLIISAEGLQDDNLNSELLNYKAASVTISNEKNQSLHVKSSSSDIFAGILSDDDWIKSSKIVTVNKSNSVEKSAVAAISKMHPGITYRVFIYKVINNVTDYSNPIEVKDFVSGVPGTITLSKNVKYEYVAYSYNLTEPITDPINNYTINTVNGRDLLYTKGAFEITSSDNTPLNILFKRQLSAFVVEFDARGLFADELLSVDATFSSSLSASKFYLGSFSLHSGEFTSTTEYDPYFEPNTVGYQVDEDFKDIKRYYIFSAQRIIGSPNQQEVNNLTTSIFSLKYKRDGVEYEFKSVDRSKPYGQVLIRVPVTVPYVNKGQVFGGFARFVEPGLRVLNPLTVDGTTPGGKPLTFAVGNIYDRGTSVDESRRFIIRRRNAPNTFDDNSYFNFETYESYKFAVSQTAENIWNLKRTTRANHCEKIWPEGAWVAPFERHLNSVFNNTNSRSAATKQYWEYNTLPRSNSDYITSPYHLQDIKLRFEKNGMKRKIYPDFTDGVSSQGYANYFASPSFPEAVDLQTKGFYIVNDGTLSGGRGKRILVLDVNPSTGGPRFSSDQVYMQDAPSNGSTLNNFTNIRCVRNYATSEPDNY